MIIPDSISKTTMIKNARLPQGGGPLFSFAFFVPKTSQICQSLGRDIYSWCILANWSQHVFPSKNVFPWWRTFNNHDMLTFSDAFVLVIWIKTVFPPIIIGDLLASNGFSVLGISAILHERQCRWFLFRWNCIYPVCKSMTRALYLWILLLYIYMYTCPGKKHHQSQDQSPWIHAHHIP